MDTILKDTSQCTSRTMIFQKHEGEIESREQPLNKGQNCRIYENDDGSLDRQLDLETYQD